MNVRNAINSAALKQAATELQSLTGIKSNTLDVHRMSGIHFSNLTVIIFMDVLPI